MSLKMSLKMLFGKMSFEKLPLKHNSFKNVKKSYQNAQMPIFETFVVRTNVIRTKLGSPPANI
jgi:hypothetical protein